MKKWFAPMVNLSTSNEEDMALINGYDLNAGALWLLNGIRAPRSGEECRKMCRATMYNGQNCGDFILDRKRGVGWYFEVSMGKNTKVRHRSTAGRKGIEFKQEQRPSLWFILCSIEDLRPRIFESVREKKVEYCFWLSPKKIISWDDRESMLFVSEKYKM